MEIIILILLWYIPGFLSGYIFGKIAASGGKLYLDDWLIISIVGLGGWLSFIFTILFFITTFLKKFINL